METKPKIIRHLPQIYQAQETDSLFYYLLNIFGQELEQVEKEIKGIIASHTVDFADKKRAKIDDLTKLGALFDIKPKDDEKIEDFRERLKETIKLYLGGLGTAEAVIGMTAIHFGCKVKKITPPTIEQSFVTKATIGTFEIEVIDSPPQFVSTQKEAVIGEDWVVCNNGLFEVTPEIIITSLDKAVVNPQITNFTTGQIIEYKGIILKGKSLVITFDDISKDLKAKIDGKDVTNKLFILKGEAIGSIRFDLSCFAQVGTSFTLPAGKSCLHYFSSSGKFDLDSFDRATFYKLKAGEFDDKSRFDQVIFATPPEVEIKFSWQEARSATFWLNLPYELFKNDVSKSILSDINIVKSAGVKAIVHLIYGYNEDPNFIQCQSLRDEAPLFKMKSQTKEEMSTSDSLSGMHLLNNALKDAQGGNDSLSGIYLLNNALVDEQGGNDSLSGIRLSSNALKDGQGSSDQLSGIYLSNSVFVDIQGISEGLTFKGVFDLTRSGVSTFT